MKRQLLPFLAWLLAAGIVAGCRASEPTTISTATTLPLATAPAQIRPTERATAASRQVTSTPVPAVAAGSKVTAVASKPALATSPTPTHTVRPASTPLPSPSPTMSATPTPTLAPASAPATGEPLAFSLGWRLNANGHLMAAAVQGSGNPPRISLASLGRGVYDLNSNSGGVRWLARTRGPAYALALLPGGNVAAGDDAGIVTVLDSRGQVVWRADLGSRVTALQATAEGALLAGGWDERLSLLDGEGSLRWQVEVGAPLTGIAILPADGAEMALATTLDGWALAFDLQGRQMWQFEAGSPLTGVSTAATGGQTLALLGVQDGRLLALDAEGALLWQRTLGSGAPVWYAAEQIDAGQPGVVVGMGGASPALALLSAGDGQVRWHVRLPSAAGAATVLDLDADGQPEILAGLADGQVEAYDLQGRRRGAVHAGLSVWGLYPIRAGSALVLADVAAWQLVAGPGSAGGPWLPAPAMLPAPADMPPPLAPDEAEGGMLIFLGDVAFGRSMEAQLIRYGSAYPWQGLEPLLQGGDEPGTGKSQGLPVRAIANLECALTTRGQPLDKGYLIRAHPLWAESLLAGGIDLVTLANNHALDFGPAGLDETASTLQEMGIAAVGAGASSTAAHRPAFLEFGGVRVALLGYAAARWDGSVDVPATDRLAWARPGDIRADVAAVRDQADVVVVLLHAGTEYAAAPSADQVAAAHAAIDAGADLVVGHHPHVTQTVERYGRGLIVYSLGDALSDIPRPAAMRGHLLRVQVTGDGLVAADLWPFWIDGAIQPRLLDGGQGLPRVEQVYP